MRGGPDLLGREGGGGGGGGKLLFRGMLQPFGNTEACESAGTLEPPQPLAVIFTSSSPSYRGGTVDSRARCAGSLAIVSVVQPEGSSQ